ncbi:unnamed protein product [Ixodes pacificus]
MMMHRDGRNPEQNEWVKKANFLVDFLVSEYSNETNAPTVELLWMPVAWDDEQSKCRLSPAAECREAHFRLCGRAHVCGFRAFPPPHLPHSSSLTAQCRHPVGGQVPPFRLGPSLAPADGGLVPQCIDLVYVRPMHRLVPVKMLNQEGFYGLHGCATWARRCTCWNLTLCLVPFPCRRLYYTVLSIVFLCSSCKNAFSGVSCVISKCWYLPVSLPCDLICSQNIFTAFFSFFIYFHHTLYSCTPTEILWSKLETSNMAFVMNQGYRALRAYNLAGGFYTCFYTYPEMYAANFVGGIIEHLLQRTPNLSNGSRCDSSQDMFYEVYRKDLKVLMESWGFRKDEANYTMLLLSPVEANTTKMKHIQDWTIINGTIKTVILRDRVSAFLQNRTIKLASLEYPPFIVLNRTSVGERKTDGTFLRLMAYLGSIYGFSVEYLLLENTTSMGTLLGDYNWTGCLGMLNHREIDWVAFLDITEVRKRSFSLTDGFMSNTVGMMVQAPRIETRKLLFLKPFQNEASKPAQFYLPIMSVVLWIIARTSPAHAQLDPNTRQAGLVKLFNCVWYLYGALLQQGGVHLPAASSARIILGFWWLYVLVVMAYYSSNLIAFLTVPEIHWIVSSFKNAVDREDLYIYVPYGTGLHQEIDTWETTLPVQELFMILTVLYFSHSTTRSTNTRASETTARTPTATPAPSESASWKECSCFCSLAPPFPSSPCPWNSWSASEASAIKCGRYFNRPARKSARRRPPSTCTGAGSRRSSRTPGPPWVLEDAL